MNSTLRAAIVKVTATAAFAGSLLAGASPAMAQTREHILLARQVGVPAAEAQLSLAAPEQDPTAGEKWVGCAVKVRSVFAAAGYEYGSPESSGAVKEMCSDLLGK